MRVKPIRSFTRGLDVLQALNRHGSASALTLSRDCGIPRATVYRLLETLVQAGYVARGLADDRFHLRLAVRQLSDGFKDTEWAVAVARPFLAQLTRDIAWPCDIVSLDGLAMMIRDTTHPNAPLSIDHNMAGRRLPLLGSSSGLAYLAFAPAHERDLLLSLLARSKDPDDALARRREEAEELLAATRRRGYAVRQGGRLWPHTGSIALPIRFGDRVLACLAVIWMARVIDHAEGVRRCLRPLKRTRSLIEQQLESERSRPRS